MFEVKEKATVVFHIVNNPLVILDSEGREYFYRDCGQLKEVKVNFPKPGLFTSNNPVKKITDFSTCRISANLPEPERDFYKKHEGKVLVVSQPFEGISPARIYSQKGIIQLNESFHSFSYPYKLFIILHESGHLRYKTEWKADLYASVLFCNVHGFNPSSCFHILERTLSVSPDNIKRLQMAIKNVTQ